MSNKPEPEVATPPNFYDFLDHVENLDGSITRLRTLPATPAAPDHPVVPSKDYILNPTKKTWLRVYLPRQALDSSFSSSSRKLPLIVYFHGGGYVICSAETSLFHEFCLSMAAQVGAVVVSVEYRLAPEHRLPAAYEDAVDALHWIKNSDDDWLKTYSDVTNCFLMGTSAGGNLAYFAGLWAIDADLGHLKIRGLILHHIFVGGTQRTESEKKLENDAVLPLRATDLMWQWALPKGADRDHEYSNPTAAKRFHDDCKKIKELGWKIWVNGVDGDLLFDKIVEFVRIMEEKGVRVVGKFGAGDYHVVELFDPSKAKAMFGHIKDFVLP
ncbi:Alpha/beta hydrolase fold-3 [Dillenia turbinata]|uniref:Alpha/beta hydrolase fold-3 n=1 Tax=Dillenia turbinata TaxID=194707 RepID=A0AAN8ZG12_9MAGN